LTLDGPFADGLSSGPDNLVLKAATALGEALAAKGHAVPGARLALTKNLPVASGIGGGSADAAAALRALDALWRTRAGEADLAALGLELGADVPVCLFARAAFVGGIGERIVAAPPLPRAFLVLANPMRAVSTAQVFAARSGAFSEAGRFPQVPKDLGELALLLAARRNDLAAAAIALCPEISRVIGALVRSPGCKLARMSGSGATCFGLYADEASAKRAAQDIAAAEPGWWVAAAALVTDTADLAPAP
jgi:4-diphosphocytidyl-2-C-methyl-D-erythritol kinase